MLVYLTDYQRTGKLGRKIYIYQSGKWMCATNWSHTCRAAKAHYLYVHPEALRVTTHFAK